jgi:hypothetical protein
MNRAPVSVLSTIAVLLAVGSLSPAAASRYCLQGRNWGYPGNCQFSTYQQCMATASGTAAHCGINPHYVVEHRRRSH